MSWHTCCHHRLTLNDSKQLVSTATPNASLPSSSAKWMSTSARCVPLSLSPHPQPAAVCDPLDVTPCVQVDEAESSLKGMHDEVDGLKQRASLAENECGVFKKQHAELKAQLNEAREANVRLRAQQEREVARLQSDAQDEKLNMEKMLALSKYELQQSTERSKRWVPWVLLVFVQWMTRLHLHLYSQGVRQPAKANPK